MCWTTPSRHLVSYSVDCECTGKELFDSVKMACMDILVNEKSTAETAVRDFDLKYVDLHSA